MRIKYQKKIGDRMLIFWCKTFYEQIVSQNLSVYLLRVFIVRFCELANPLNEFHLFPNS